MAVNLFSGSTLGISAHNARFKPHLPAAAKAGKRRRLKRTDKSVLFHGAITLFFLFCLSAGAQSTAVPTNPDTVVAAKQVTAYTLPPDKLRKAKALYQLGQKLLVFGTLYSWLVLIVVLYSGIAVRYRDWAEAIFRQRFLQGLVFVPLLWITLAIPNLPLRIYGHHVSLQYGLSVQGWGSWFADYGKSWIINTCILCVILWILQAMMRLSPRRWWFYCWLEILPIFLFVVFIWPVVVDPLFNDFEPLQDKNPRLVEEIEKLARRAGVNIPPNHLYEMKASEKVTTLNAYVTGFGASKRVVIWDTMIEKTTLPVTLAVVGHELGHYVLHHVIQGVALGSLGLLASLYFLFRLANWTRNRFGSRWRIQALDDWAAVPMLVLLALVLEFLALPVGNGFSRHIEHQADVYGLEVTHSIIPDSQQAAAQSFQILGELSLDYPYPNRLEVFWYDTHPTIADRLRFALEYDPWAKGEKPKYVQ